MTHRIYEKISRERGGAWVLENVADEVDSSNSSSGSLAGLMRVDALHSWLAELG